MQRIRKRLRLIGLASLLVVCATSSASEPTPMQARDPFDYSYCGGKPMYPVIGFNFGTFCGPRNQIALGRRGLLMWSFPTSDGRVHARGRRQLTTAELDRLTLLAEAAQLAGPPAAVDGPVVYDLGVNFSGRPYKRAHGALKAESNSIQQLFDAMQAMINARPLLPTCADAPRDFAPTQLPTDRVATGSQP